MLLGRAVLESSLAVITNCLPQAQDITALFFSSLLFSSPQLLPISGHGNLRKLSRLLLLRFQPTVSSTEHHSSSLLLSAGVLPHLRSYQHTDEEMNEPAGREAFTRSRRNISPKSGRKKGCGAVCACGCPVCVCVCVRVCVCLYVCAGGEVRVRGVVTALPQVKLNGKNVNGTMLLIHWI